MDVTVAVGFVAVIVGVGEGWIVGVSVIVGVNVGLIVDVAVGLGGVSVFVE